MLALGWARPGGGRAFGFRCACTSEAGVVPNDWIAPGHPHGSRHGVGTAPMAQNRWISLCLHWDALRTGTPDPPRGVGRVY